VKRRPSKNQSGYTLILFVLVLMSAGGLLLVEFSEGMLDAYESKKYEHNKRVLKEAKAALLQYAYNYPVFRTPPIGPGRLPNADTNNDGSGDDGSTFGRLPWNQANLNLYDIRDADDERLWYAVSSSFRPQTTDPINSDTSGKITLRDQSGNVIYDGSNPDDLTQYGIAAVIIAPGAPIVRNDGLVQDRSDDNVNAKEHYLDDTDDEDNATYSSGADGFILGPINNLTNDQFIVITAAEVAAMAEKATLQTYQTAINDYLIQTGNVHPWLYNYVVPASEAISSFYPANSVWTTELAINLNPGNIGRIPTIFSDYFSETNSLTTFDSTISGSIGITIPEDIACSSCENNFTYIDDEFRFNDFTTIKTPVFLGDPLLTDVRFVDLANEGEGRLTGNAASAVSGTLEMYFWDYDHDETTIYTPCGDDGDGIPEVTDCHRDSSDDPDPGGPNKQDLIILLIKVSFDFPYSVGAVNIDMYYATDPTITVEPATGASHALIKATFAGTNIINSTMPTISGGSFEIDDHYHDGDTYLYQDEGPHDTGSINSSTFVVEGPLTLGIRYYPELPDWALDNGWHESVMMAYAADYRPDNNGATGDCAANPPCLQINGFGGIINDKVSILVLAAEQGWVDGDVDPDVAADGSYANDVGDVFNLENSNLDGTFDYRTVEDTGAPGDMLRDKILVVN